MTGRGITLDRHTDGTSGLPTDPAVDQTARLQILYGVGVALWAINLLMDVWLAPNGDRGPHRLAIEAVAVLLAGVTALFMRRSRMTPRGTVGQRPQEARAVGSYQLVERLGEGGMGEVWVARHRMLARTAAIKLVRPDRLGEAGSPDAARALDRFEREAQATAALTSPHTIRLFDFGLSREGAFYYVMELLDGCDLESLVRDHGPLPAARATYLLQQICRSLAEAHAKGFVHRDIKPANVYVCRMGLDVDFVKVLDFGLVKQEARDGAAPTLTGQATAMGTPAYMAPEVILGGGDVDRRVDVYAIGCVAYYLLTGERVFEAITDMRLMVKHLHEEPVPPSRRSEQQVPPDLDALVLACLRKNPDERPADAGEVLRRLSGCDSGTWDQGAAQSWWALHMGLAVNPGVCRV